jgi:hypothetical protein
LVANYLWIRAGRAVASRSTVSLAELRDLIDRLLSKEIGYFLGVGVAADNTEESIEHVIGQSNIFFVIDNLILYPTYLIVDAICGQLKLARQGLMKLHVSLGTYLEADSTKEHNKKKEEAKQENPNWVWGAQYGEGVLDVGRDEGTRILNSAQITRVNLAVQISKILEDVYDSALKYM